VEPACGVHVEQVDRLLDLLAGILDVLEGLVARASAARDWMFWPTKMIGSSTS
jgi:hypothetical protein